MSAFSGEDGEAVRPGEESVPEPEEHVDEGSNLVDSRPPVLTREPLLLDLSRELVEARLFDSYTYTGVIFRFFSQNLSILKVVSQKRMIFPGISSPLLSFRPFSLKQGSRYMLEVTASKFQNGTTAYISFVDGRILIFGFTLRICGPSGTDSAFPKNQPCSRRDNVPGATSQRIGVSYTFQHLLHLRETGTSAHLVYSGPFFNRFSV